MEDLPICSSEGCSNFCRPKAKGNYDRCKVCIRRGPSIGISVCEDCGNMRTKEKCFTCDDHDCHLSPEDGCDCTKETAYTPGPWSRNGYNIEGEDGKVCHVDCSMRGMVNARLIAASPELLEAAQEIYDSLYDSGIDRSKLGLAIAKAK